MQSNKVNSKTIFSIGLLPLDAILQFHETPHQTEYTSLLEYCIELGEKLAKQSTGVTVLCQKRNTSAGTGAALEADLHEKHVRL